MGAINRRLYILFAVNKLIIIKLFIQISQIKIKSKQRVLLLFCATSILFLSGLLADIEGQENVVGVVWFFSWV